MTRNAFLRQVYLSSGVIVALTLLYAVLSTNLRSPYGALAPIMPGMVG